MDPIPYEQVSLEEANASVPGQPTKIRASSPPRTSLAVCRQPAHNNNDLAANTFKWIAMLPREARPNALAIKFPRIANRLAEVWNRPLDCERYLDDLITDYRGDRQGFPLDVASDLTTLKKHFLKTAKTFHYGAWGNRIGFD